MNHWTKYWFYHRMVAHHSHHEDPAFAHQITIKKLPKLFLARETSHVGYWLVSSLEVEQLELYGSFLMRPCALLVSWWSFNLDNWILGCCVWLQVVNPYSKSWIHDDIVIAPGPYGGISEPISVYFSPGLDANKRRGEKTSFRKVLRNSSKGW